MALCQRGFAYLAAWTLRKALQMHMACSNEDATSERDDVVAVRTLRKVLVNHMACSGESVQRRCIRAWGTLCSHAEQSRRR